MSELEGGNARVATAAEVRRTPMDVARSGPYFFALLLTALVAFWPSYLSQLGANSLYTHVHAVLATTWILMLIAQPMLIRGRRRDLHRTFGKISYGLAPLVVVSIVLLAHNRIADVTPEAFPTRTYILYLQTSLVALFAGCYLMAIRYRREMAVHARFMYLYGLHLDRSRDDPTSGRDGLVHYVESAVDHVRPDGRGDCYTNLVRSGVA